MAKPKPSARDLLVKVYAFATNPVDVKKRLNFGAVDAPIAEPPLIVGWDAAGVVEAVGVECKLFKVGDQVMFAGVLNRQGSYAEYCCVDERIVGRKPSNLSWEESASVPLCALTAWEGMVERMGIPLPVSPSSAEAKKNASKSILIIGGAGGVGSITIQLAKKVLHLGHVIATASRPDSVAWCKKQGADHVIDHSKPLLPQFKEIGLTGVDYVYCTVDLFLYSAQVLEVTKALGKVCSITGISPQVDWSGAFYKGISLCPELMFTKGLFGVEMESQGEILNSMADLIERQAIHHTLTTRFDFTLGGIRSAQTLQESGKSIGKTAVTVVKWA